MPVIAEEARMSCDAETLQAPIVAHFARGAKRIDTQGAIVLLKGDEAIKIRRAIRLPFLDYSTLEKRRAAAEAEIAINRAYAPHIYIEAAAIRRTRDGYGFQGDGEIVEWATRMRRFDENATLDKVAARGELGDEILRKLAKAIRAMHANAPIRQAAPALAAMRLWIEQNATAFVERPDLFAADAAAQLSQDAREALERLTPMLMQRGAEGAVRRCHGDLHLRNIAVIDGEPTPFDAIEFDETIAIGDILYDLAFALMDLWQRDLKRQANLLFNAYLADCDALTLSALGALPVFLSLRAAIRAKVAANAGANEEARRYFEFARSFLRPAPPRLVAVGGLSGTGKSALCAGLAPDIGAAPGAVWLRSDVERKHLFGVDELTPLPDEAYFAAANEATYARLIEKARRALQAGASVLIDAAHTHGGERAVCAALAREIGVPFAGLWLEAPLDVRLVRIASRRDDASDADEAVARRQRAEALLEPGWREIDAGGALDQTLRIARVASGADAGI
jgi:aminoglycoside phosphotransferase family enzyme/predicted kinase